MTHARWMPALTGVMLTLALFALGACALLPMPSAAPAAMYGGTHEPAAPRNEALIDELVARGEMEMQRGYYAAAVDLYQSALRLDPRHPLALAGLAQARYRSAHAAEVGGDFDVAEEGTVEPLPLLDGTDTEATALTSAGAAWPDEAPGPMDQPELDSLTQALDAKAPGGAADDEIVQVDPRIADQVELIIRNIYGQKLTEQRDGDAVAPQN